MNKQQKMKLSRLAVLFIIVMTGSCRDATQTNSNTYSSSTKCVNICCDSILYHGITSEELDTGIINYRNNDWWKTSRFFTPAEPFGRASMKKARQTTNQLMDPDGFDARYMDVDLVQLENYLCFVRRIAAAKQIDRIRFYYIQYADNNSGMQSVHYRKKHSLAMIPVSSREEEIPIFKDDISLIFSPQSGIANHNSLCPPEPPACSIRLSTIDDNPNTYPPQP